MNKKEIRKIFMDVHNGVMNLMTPNLIEYGITPKGLLYEISTGKVPKLQEPGTVTLYGVTLIVNDNDRYRKVVLLNDDDKKRLGIDCTNDAAFNTLEEAKEYVQSI